MDYFKYNNGRLFCEDVDLKRMDGITTPFYLYSWNTFAEHFLRFKESFKVLDPLICFSVKTCNNLSILKGLADLGAGMDIVSGGELFLSARADVDARKIVYAGVGKTVEEIGQAIDSGIGFFNVESEPEFIRIESIAQSKKKTVNALLRVNPDEYDRNTHDKTNTGKKGGKFGVDLEQVPAFFEAYGRSSCLKLVGLHIHIGSPIYSAVPYTKAITKIIDLIGVLNAKGFTIGHLDVGGGYAADYEDGASPSWDAYSDEMVPLLKPLADRGIGIIMEPGRTISANAGILVTSVQYIKKVSGDKSVIITDTGMHHLIRPALYNASHFIWPIDPGDAFSVSERKFEQTMNGLVSCDVVGPICESSDYLAKDRKLPPLAPDHRLAIFTAGAYGIVMSSQYNAQPRPAEYMVSGNTVNRIREREVYGDLIGKQCHCPLSI